MAMSNPNHDSDSPREIKLSGDSTDGVDFISPLPDVILHDILSYIPTKYAIRTSALSKRWKRVWHETPSISIDCNREDHVDSIDETLSSYSPLKIKSFDLRISYDISITTMLPYRWIELAMSGNTENLSLILESYYSFPDFFYVNSSIKQLSLTFRGGLYTDLHPQCTVSWTSLRNLSFNSCIIPDESIANILSGCPMLETLILNRCADIHHLDLSTSVNLTRLEISGGLGPDEIVAPHIRYLSLKNFHKLPNLVDVSSLTEANLGYIEYIKYGIVKAEFLQDMVLKVLAKLKNVEKLTIGTVVLQILSLAELHGVPFPRFKIKALTVETIVVQSVVPGIVRLLQNSHELKKITIHTTKCKAIGERELNIYLNTQRLYNDQCWSKFFPTVEETYSSLNSGHVALFVELVILNAKRLETMVLRLGGYHDAIECQFLLSMVPVFSRKTLANLNSFKIIP